MAIEQGISRTRAMACRASGCNLLEITRKGFECGAAKEIILAQRTNATVPGVNVNEVMDAAKGLVFLEMPGDCSRRDELLNASPLPLQP